MTTFNLSDDVLSRFEQACSLGQEVEKEISLKPEDAAQLLNIFETSLQEDPAANQALVRARDVFKRLAGGKTVSFYNSEKLTFAQKAATLFKRTFGERSLNYVDVNVQGVDWVKTAHTVVQKKFHLEKAANYIDRANKASDATTIAELKEAAAREYISLGMHERAFELRAQIAQLSFPHDHCLSDMGQAVVKASEGKPLPRMGAYFQGLDTGCVKQGTLHASKRRMVKDSSDEKEVPQDLFCFDCQLTHWARAELDKALQQILEHSEDLQRITGHAIHISLGKTTIIPAYIEEKDVYDLNSGYPVGKSLEIDIGGVGKICIHTDPSQHSLYNRIEIILNAKTNQGAEGVRNLHTIFSLLGLGTALCPSRPEDETRIKIFTLLHAFFPALSYQMERDPVNYTISTEKLRQKICSKEPKAEEVLKKYIDTSPELFVKEELYSGRQTYMIKDMGDQVREHSCGLLFGTKSAVSSRLGWKNPLDARERFREIAESYVQKLRAGVAMESNREDWLCRGKICAGESPGLDMAVGGFDSVFTRIFPNAFIGKEMLPDMPFCSDGIRVLLDSDVMGYASCYAYRTDRFGARVDTSEMGNPEPDKSLWYSERSGLPDFARQIQVMGEKQVAHKEKHEKQKPKVTANEVMMRDLIPSKFIRALLVKRQLMKDVLVEELRKAGLIQKRGEIECVVLPGCEKPVDEFIYVGDTCQREMWAKPPHQSAEK